MLDMMKENKEFDTVKQASQSSGDKTAYKGTRLGSIRNEGTVVQHMSHADAQHLGRNVKDVGGAIILIECAETPANQH